MAGVNRVVDAARNSTLLSVSLTGLVLLLMGVGSACSWGADPPGPPGKPRGKPPSDRDPGNKPHATRPPAAKKTAPPQPGRTEIGRTETTQPPPALKRSDPGKSPAARPAPQKPLPRNADTRVPATGPPPDAAATPVAVQSSLSPPLPAAPPPAPTDTGTPPPVVEPFLPWHQSLIRDRSLEVRLRSAGRQLDADDLSSALASLQHVLDESDDIFVRVEADARPSGAHQIASRMLSGLSRDGLRLYQILYGSEASQLLIEARNSGDLELFAQVVRRFYHTDAGFEACDWLATKCMDHGTYATAAAYWCRLLNEPVHRHRIQAMQRLKAAYCLQRSGRHREAELLKAQLPADNLLVAGHSVQAATWLLESTSESERLPAADAPVIGGGPDRNRVCPGSAPVLSQPLWTIPLARSNSKHVEDLATAWEAWQLNSGQPLGVSHFPLVTGGTVVYRDFEGVRAVDLQTGRQRWSYTSDSALCRDVPVQTAVPEGNPDPGNLMRFLVGNATLGMLSSDGRRVFAIDQLESNWNQHTASSSHGTGPDTATLSRQTNTLVALDLHAQGDEPVKPLWVLGGPVEGEGPHLPLAGRFFLGPPLPVGDLLYAVTELDRQLAAVCIKSASGTVVWSQELCSVQVPVHSDQPRYYFPCPTAYADGVLVCPTQAGVIVGVDALTGRLLWAHAYDDPQQRMHSGMWPNSVVHPKGHPGYQNLPLIQGTSIIYLPPHSEAIHCVDLHTGRMRWSARREDMEQATEYVAAATPNTVMIVGRRRCRGLSLESGAEQWALRLGSSPSGRGARVGAHYLVPLAEGRIVNLEIETGQRIGFSLPRAGSSPGNLSVSGDLLISMGRSQITAYPQAAALLEQMVALTSATAVPAEKLLLAAELELILGRNDAARDRLLALRSHAVTLAAATQGEALLRELLFTQLRTATADQELILDQLDDLPAAPEQRGRYLFQRADFEQRRGNPEGALAAARELVSLNLQTPLLLDDDPSRAIAVDAWVRSLLARIWRDADASQLIHLSHQIDDDLEAAFVSGDVNTLRHLAFVFAGWPQADRARLQLARSVLSQGAYQEAELALLECRSSDVPAVSGEAARMLVEIWNERGLYHEAALLLEQLGTRFADIDVAPGVTGARYVARFPRDAVTWSAYQRLSAGAALSESHIRISEQRWFNGRLHSTYNGNGMQHHATPRGSSFDLFDKGQQVEGQLVVIDRHSGVEFDDVIKVPARYYPPAPQHAFIGHFFPLGTPGAVYGVSLLERKTIWGPSELTALPSNDVVRVGPAGPGFCTFQRRPYLYVLDPANGRLLWKRNDLDAMTGMMTDLYSGLFGDSQVLTLFGADRCSYTVFDTATGAERCRGKLDIDQRTRRVFGRLLFYMSNTPDARRLRIWDPLTDRLLLDEPAANIMDASMLAGVPAGTKLMTFLNQSDELACITSSGHARVIDVRTGDLKVDTPLPAEQLLNLGTLRAFSDHDRYYINLQRYPTSSETMQTSYIASDTTLPAVHVQGDLCAIDRQSKQVAWSRPFGNRSVLQLPDFKLPVLIGLCRIRRVDRLSLQVEVVDSRTGQVRAVQDGLLPDRILQLSYNHEPATIELRGAKTEIRLEFQSAEPSDGIVPDVPNKSRFGLDELVRR